MSRIEEKIKSMGLILPESSKPVAAYVPARKAGSIVYTSGQLPMLDGKLTAEGIVGKNVTPEVAKAAALQCALNGLAAIRGVIGDLDKIRSIVKVTCFVASTPEFVSQPVIANGASEFLLEVFGESGRHCRSAVGMACLPLNAPVEVELMMEVDD